MKSCELCGYENESSATVCEGCGSYEFVPSPRRSQIVTERTAVRSFRALVLASLALCLAWIGLEWYLYLVPEADFSRPEVHDALAWRGYDAAVSLPPIAGWLFLLLYVAASAGLLRFSWPARLVFTALVAANVALTSLGGLHVETSVGAAIALILSLTDGAIVALAWASPLKHRFVRL